MWSTYEAERLLGTLGTRALLSLCLELAETSREAVHTGTAQQGGWRTSVAGAQSGAENTES